jgi:SecD/SecF fusion protein
MTAVAATRAMLGLLAGFRWFDNPRFMGATATEIPKWQHIDVVTRRRFYIGLSVALIALSFVVIGVKGLNLGIDFKGGVQVTFTTPTPTSLSDVRDETAKIGHSDAIVQGRGSLTGTDEYKSFQIRLKKLDPNEQQKLTDTLRDDLTAGKLGVKNVSSSFSKQILEGAIVAIVVSFLLIAFYVTLRYRWRFAVPILRTLISDIPITLGVYAISGREVSASTVAAILTILGYSVYDTIIVFDRIRENMRLMPRASIARIANVSVSEVLRRSIYTSTITLLPIIALFIFGGATLKDFAFAIIVGIAVGAVSTIFIATPLLTNLMERDPEYARRRDDVEGEPSKWTMRRAERAAAAAPAPDTPVDAIEEAVGAVVGDGGDGDGDGGNGDTTLDAKRERRRQRRKARPHGRAR